MQQLGVSRRLQPAYNQLNRLLNGWLNAVGKKKWLEVNTSSWILVLHGRLRVLNLQTIVTRNRPRKLILIESLVVYSSYSSTKETEQKLENEHHHRKTHITDALVLWSLDTLLQRSSNFNFQILPFHWMELQFHQFVVVVLCFLIFWVLTSNGIQHLFESSSLQFNLCHWLISISLNWINPLSTNLN